MVTCTQTCHFINTHSGTHITPVTAPIRNGIVKQIPLVLSKREEQEIQALRKVQFVITVFCQTLSPVVSRWAPFRSAEGQQGHVLSLLVALKKQFLYPRCTAPSAFFTRLDKRRIGREASGQATCSLHRSGISCCPLDPHMKFKGHPRPAGSGCWVVVQLRVPTEEPESQLQQPIPCGCPLLLSAGKTGFINEGHAFVSIKANKNNNTLLICLCRFDPSTEALQVKKIQVFNSKK